MGTYTDLSVDGFALWSTKSWVVPELMTVFRESDKEDNSCDESEFEAAITYSCTTSSAIQRLDVMGFTLKRVRDEFESKRASELEELEEEIQDPNDPADWLLEQKEILKLLSFDSYSEGLRTVLDRGLTPWALEPKEELGLAKAREDPILRHILCEESDYPYYPFGFLGSDPRTLVTATTV